jgi:hypothetical protein
MASGHSRSVVRQAYYCAILTTQPEQVDRRIVEMSEWGQSRRFEPASLTSGLPRNSGH